MKILVPRSSPSLKSCDPFDCSRFHCDKYYVDGKKQKQPFFKKAKKATPDCARFHCGQVTIPGEEK